MSGEGQHPIAGEAAAHANRVYTTADDRHQPSVSQDFQNACENCIRSSFSETDGLRLDELKDKLSKLAKVTSDPDLKSRATDMIHAAERLDTWQLRDWQEIQASIRAVRTHSDTEYAAYDQVSVGQAARAQAPVDGKRIVKTTAITKDATMADEREKAEVNTPLLKRFVTFLRQLG